MAATELSAAGAGPKRPVASHVLRVYLALLGLTLTGAALTALAARDPVRHAMRLALSATANARPSPRHVLGLAAHNLPICAWPLLLGSLQLPERSRWRAAADVLVIGCALANVLPVAAALGAYGRPLVAFVVQLPLEWAALAVGYGSWAAERDARLSGRERLLLLGALIALALAAAALETYAVPHR
jgi:hypothetical protein